MEYYIVPVDNIEFENNNNSYLVTMQGNNLMDFCVSNSLPPSILNDNFQFWFGKFHLERIKQGNYFLVQDFHVIEPFKTDEELQKIMNDKNAGLHFFYGSALIFSLCLWIIKDNSVSIPLGIYHNNSIGGGFPMTKNVMISNSRGAYNTLVFSKEEFQKANEWLDVLAEYFIEDTVVEREYSDYNNLNSDINHNTNSFKRALTYIEQARSTSFLPAKIAHYISVLETLFVVTDSNTYKTPERTAVFLGGPKEERSNVFKIVKDSYKVRSSYVHGSDIAKKLNKKLDHISSDLDSVLRKVLIKFLTEFKELNYSGNDYTRVDQYFVDLVLGGS
ncbi:hypothetical protein [Priestia aryabhattai]|uniref:hypothetical protein n=1 Tax=Priestia aryabhattai TaxID=412384 RepID=UPI002E214C3F|nr:HEPN domain-containing protein [Priestia aryabhattai]MED4261364.1 HEPN domain-containing protein [Priestia aryabhattai]